MLALVPIGVFRMRTEPDYVTAAIVIPRRFRFKILTAVAVADATDPRLRDGTRMGGSGTARPDGAVPPRNLPIDDQALGECAMTDAARLPGQ